MFNPVKWWRMRRRIRFWTATEAQLDKALGGEGDGPPGKRFFGVKWTWWWCVVLLLAGCVSYREERPDGTRVHLTVIGGGNRLIRAPRGIVVTHSQIPETLTAAGQLAGEAAKAAVAP